MSLEKKAAAEREGELEELRRREQALKEESAAKRGLVVSLAEREDKLRKESVALQEAAQKCMGPMVALLALGEDPRSAERGGIDHCGP